MARTAPAASSDRPREVPPCRKRSLSTSLPYLDRSVNPTCDPKTSDIDASRSQNGVGSAVEQLRQLRQRVVGIADLDGVQPGRSSADDVAGAVVEEHRT